MTYTHFRDLFASRFVLVRPSDPIVYHVWTGRAKNDIIQENENHRKVHVQWLVLARRGAKNDEELYHNCWLNKWNYNHVNPI
jgi:hypothetical protein